MLEEIERDAKDGRTYFGRRLTDAGRRDWPGLLREAAAAQTPEWLAGKIQPGYHQQLRETYVRNGHQYERDVNQRNAAEMLAEGEFNRFYIRAVCLAALQSGEKHVIAYRAKAVARPRPDSEDAIGTEIDAQALLDDLRTNQGGDTIYGLPGGPNSGLSVCLPTSVTG